MPYDLKPLDVDADTTPYVEAEGWGAGGDRWALNFGPQHPATHTTLRIVMELDGERVVRAVPHIGYLHSGFEKLAEAMDYNQYVTIASRMNYVSPICNDISWHNAAEKLFDVDITPRCKAVRTILGELGRIQDHLLCVGASALDLGAFTGFIYGFNEREGIMDVMDYLAGQRFHPDWTRLGGAMNDLPDEATFIKLVKRVIHDLLPPAIDDLEGLLNKNRIFRDRTEGIGAVTHDEAIAWSLSGPVARASGVKRDVRKDEPYLCFADNWDKQGSKKVDFKVPLATTGDVFGRYLVRLEEIRQSIHIIEHFELVMTNRKWKAPINETYACIESPNGQHGFYLVADGGPHPWRAKHRPCSFVHFAAFGKMLEGHLLADAVAILGSLNVIAAELDR